MLVILTFYRCGQPGISQGPIQTGRGKARCPTDVGEEEGQRDPQEQAVPRRIGRRRRRQDQVYFSRQGIDPCPPTDV